MKTKITIRGKTGLEFTYTSEYSLEQLIWDAFLTAEYQDEQWNDRDTMKLIVRKLKGESSVEYLDIDTQV